MKSVIQVVALFVVVVGAVFGLTFFTQFTPNKNQGTGPTDSPPVVTELLKRHEKTASWDPKDPQYVQEFAKGAKAHYDFLVENANDKPVTVTLDSKFACTCTNLDILIGVLPTEARAKLKDVKPAPSGAALEPYLAGVTWKSISHDPGQPAPKVDISAGDAGGP